MDTHQINIYNYYQQQGFKVVQYGPLTGWVTVENKSGERHTVPIPQWLIQK